MTSIAADMSIKAPTFVPFRKDLQPANNSDVAGAYRGEFRLSRGICYIHLSGTFVNTVFSRIASRDSRSIR
jgi:hypothetical protein